MCGIAGFYNLTQTGFIVDEQALERMQQKLTHRGPDDEGQWISHTHQIGLVNRRLAIIDLSHAGKQPMSDQEGKTTISFNGEIYNHQQLRHELQALGYLYFSKTDTETLLYAYQEWGISFLSKLEGQFAFALFDRDRREFYLVRDRIGEKPLYFSLQNGVLSFSSEIKALWELSWNEKKLSSLGIYHYLTFMVTPAPFTIFEGIYKLPAGFYLKVDADRNISFSEWYTPLTQLSAAEKIDYQDERFCIERIRTLLTDSVKKCMLADVPVGAFLSGGLDSSLLVSLMANHTSKLKTFTITCADDKQNNEASWARMVADCYGTEHHEIMISEKDAFDFYQRMVYYLDEPLADCVCIPFYFVAQCAKNAGVTVVQVGEGADELFFGYSTYAQYKQLYESFWQPTQQFVPSVIKKNISSFATLLTKRVDYQELFSHWAHDRPLFWSGALAFGERQKNGMLKTSFFSSACTDAVIEKIFKGFKQDYDSFAVVDYYLTRLKSVDATADFCKQVLYLELKHRLPELLLMRADKMSMAASVEARVPFLDHRLIEFMLHVPASLKYRNHETKYLLKKVAQGIIPDLIIQRKKVGFAAPTLQWFSSGTYFPAYFQAMSTQHRDSFFNDSVNNIDHSMRGAVQKWVLQNLWAMNHEK